MRGLLPWVTSPVHRYVMESVNVRADASKQYLQDLQENWMLESTPIRRHQLSRQFRSRLAELQFAEWLEMLTWWRFEPQLEHGGIAWHKPQLGGADQAWSKFIETQKKHYPNLLTDITTAVTSLDAIWILRHTSEFEFSRVFEISPHTNGT